MDFAHLWHLHPWDIDRLTIAEFDAFASATDEHRAAVTKTARGVR